MAGRHHRGHRPSDVAGAHQNTAVVSADQADPVATNNTAVATASTAPTVAPCTTVCFSGPTSFLAGDFDLEFGAEKGDFNEDGYLDLVYGPVGVNTSASCSTTAPAGSASPRP